MQEDFFMDNSNTGTFDIYKDISARTNGEIYIGVVGGVRSGKSTFIKRFMELMVLPFMEDENEKKRAVDEMPQSAGNHDHDHGAEIYSQRGGNDQPFRRY